MAVLKKIQVIALAALLAFCFACTAPFTDGSQPAGGSPSTEAESSLSESSVLPEESGSSLPAEEKTGTGKLAVHFIDVDQGDSAFIELPDGQCMLIDCGERNYVGRVITLIDLLGYKKIDHIVVTHPHTDHMGGMALLLGVFDVGEIYMPDVTANTDAFLDLLGAIESKGLSINVAAAGVALATDYNGLSAEFVGPVNIYPNDLNNCSAVLKTVFGETSFLFTGDAESKEEADILVRYGDSLKCSVLKAGHHGSSTSSSAPFLKSVGAETAVISCGKDNKYGHPHAEALERFAAAGIKNVFRTDLSGTVNVLSDGKTYSVSVGTPELDYKWVLNISGMKIHRPECGGAVSTAEKNRACSARSIAELESFGFTRCGTCKPEE